MPIARLLAVALFVIVATAALTTSSAAGITPVPDVLHIAKDLRARNYADHVYGSASQGPKRIDCVQFVVAVIREVAKSEQRSSAITPELERAIKIVLSDRDMDRLQSLVEANDACIQGVRSALVGAGLGRTVEPKDARPGDFVQYWYRGRDGKWYGHSGIVETIDGSGLATIYGSHRTTLQSERSLPAAERKGGVGSGPRFRLTDGKRRVFVVRWKPRG